MSNKCLHCKLPTVADEKFCCVGCKIAYKTIHQLGFAQYYQNRITGNNIIDIKPDEDAKKLDFDISDFVQENHEGYFYSYLLVKGLYCGACVWLIESILRKDPNVKTARINMSNKRLYLVWYGHKTYGNQLIEKINKIGYKLIPYDADELKKEEDQYGKDLIKALAVAGFAAGNVMLASVAIWSSEQKIMGLATHSFLYWVSSIIALPAIIYSGRIFFKSALKSLKSGASNMDVAICVAIIITTIFSIYEIINQAEHAYFDSAIMLIFFLLIGRYLEFIVRRKALSISDDFSLLSAKSAIILDKNGKNKIIAAKNIKKDMVLNVAMGDKIAADGIVIEGESEVDTKIIDGESNLKKISKNSEVFGGTINCGPAIQVKVTKSQKNSLLGKINDLVKNLENEKGQFTKIADRISRYYTPIVHTLALTTFIYWYFFFDDNFSLALLKSVAVLIITCPCALALAVPIVLVVTNSRLLKRGIIVKSGLALEKLKDVDSIIFDKTGTLTLGKPSLKSAKLIKNGQEQKIEQEHHLFQLASAIASKSNHPLAQSLSKYLDKNFDNLKNITEIAGNGLKAQFDDSLIKLGKKEFCLNKNDNYLVQDRENPQIFLKFQDEIVVFDFADQLKDDAKKVIKLLKSLKKEIILLSGDKKAVVEKIASDLQIKKFYYEKDPIAKTDIVKDLKNKGKNILMCGDGINDAPSLMLSDVSVSFSKASDIARNVADIIIRSDNLQPVYDVLKVGKRSNKIIKENFAISFLYNFIAVPFAFLGYVTPFIAALSMSLSSIVVMLNSIKKPQSAK